MKWKSLKCKRVNSLRLFDTVLALKKKSLPLNVVPLTDIRLWIEADNCGANAFLDGGNTLALIEESAILFTLAILVPGGR